MGLKDVYKGIFIPKAGIIDADCIVKFYEEEFLKLGGEIRYGVKVERLIVEACKPLGIAWRALLWQESRVSGVKTNSGIIKAEKTILAAGAWIPTTFRRCGG
jgi:glycine/D-amino acid oxidase-like deaminating enzyme